MNRIVLTMVPALISVMQKMDARNNFKNKESQKKLIKRGSFVIIACIALFVAFSGCNKQEGMNEDDSLFLAEISDEILYNITIDNNHAFYFVKTVIDKEALENWPPYSSSMPCRHYLLRKADETSDFEIIDDRFVGGKLCFDKNNHLWSWTLKTIYKKGKNSYQKIIELPYDGLFSSFAVDKDNNIWAGASTGLYKIDSKLNITHYNSELPTNCISDIHIDKNNNIWIALCNRGILKITKDQWVVYENVSSYNIWSLITDKNDHLWIGTGFFNEEDQSLRRFDGTQWETVTPRNDKNEHVKGTVRWVQSDGQKIYTLVEHVRVFPNGGGAEQISNELLTFDGVSWNKIHEIPDKDEIFDLVVDHYRQAVWVVTNKGFHKIPINLIK